MKKVGWGLAALVVAGSVGGALMWSNRAEAQGGGSNCDCWSNWVCPTDGETVDYAAPGCGQLTYWTARNVCNSWCDADCVNAGTWFCP